MVLSIDIETYSSNDLSKCGVYKYVEAEDFTILLFAYQVDDYPVEIIDIANGDRLDSAIQIALTDPDIIKKSHNANFERTCIAKFLDIDLPPDQWECTMIKASMLGLPMSLEAVAKVLKLSEQKDSAGKALIRYFSLPCKPTKANGMRTRNLPEHDLEKWEAYKNYCIQDVVTEKAISNKISFFNIPETEKRLWQLDQLINDGGILLDPEFVNQAIAMDEINKLRLIKEAVELTGLDNPNSAAQLKSWLSDQTGETVTDLTKKAIPVLLENTPSPTVKRLLNIRQEMSKTSVKKYTAMLKGICADSRVRGLLQFNGANRTGRWAGRLVQVQNLPKNFLEDLDLARQLVREGNTDMVSLLFDNIPDTLSQLIRTAFIAPGGSRFLVSDFKAIEAVVIAWLAGEKWRMDVFNTHGKIYEASAVQMFKVPMDSISYKDAEGKTLKGRNYEMRAKGKVAELALGYQGGPNALIKMGALDMGISEEELPKLVAMWRNANPAIVRLWNIVGDAAMKAVAHKIPIQAMHGLRFCVEKNILFITLPSGRRLAYLRPAIKQGKYGTVLTYEGMDQTTKKWCSQETYGGKLVENITQAVARDCLADAMLRVDAAGYKIVMHVHDEIVCEMPDNKGSLDEVNKILSTPICWAKGLPLNADSYETVYYKKD